MKKTIKFIYFTLALIAFLFPLVTNSYSNEIVFLGESKTIKELKQDLNVLDNNKIELEEDLNKLNTDYELKSFLKKDLSSYDILTIKKIISYYNENKNNLEKQIEDKSKNLLIVIDEKKLLLEEKRKLYSGLVPYINQKYKKEYLEYVKGDIQIFKKQKELKTNITIKKEILHDKVENIENKIKEHKKILDDNLKKIINLKLEEKINNLKKNPSFETLSNNKKIIVLDNTIDKIKLKLSSFQEIETLSGDFSKNNIIGSQKVQTYNIAVEKLEKFRDSISEKKN